MIPKKIHYCWFGGKPLPELAEKCIASWQKYCPDYEIIRWDESNFDITSNSYVHEAYNAKKFAFVTDYVRLYVLYQYGGIYMDTDVEVLKPLDRFLHHPAFSGFESPDKVPTGIMASEQGGKWIEQNLHYYDSRHFINKKGEYDFTTNVMTITKNLLHDGFELNNKFQEHKNIVAMYPCEFFCPKSHITMKITLTQNSYTIHHFAGSWLPWHYRLILFIEMYSKRFLGEKITELLRKIKRIFFPPQVN